MILCVYDTESTDLVSFKDPSDAPHQPHIVELAAVLLDTVSREVVSSINVLVKPNGWKSTPEALAVHGITEEMAGDLGVREDEALDMFLALWRQRPRVGYNEGYDMRIIRSACKRYRDRPGDAAPLSDIWKEGESSCVMRLVEPEYRAHMKATGGKSKLPTLGEAHELILGQPIVGAHRAMNDVLATCRIALAVWDRTRAAPIAVPAAVVPVDAADPF